jgi:hypothetical protein
MCWLDNKAFYFHHPFAFQTIFVFVTVNTEEEKQKLFEMQKDDENKRLCCPANTCKMCN